MASSVCETLAQKGSGSAGNRGTIRGYRIPCHIYAPVGAAAMNKSERAFREDNSGPVERVNGSTNEENAARRIPSADCDSGGKHRFISDKIQSPFVLGRLLEEERDKIEPTEQLPRAVNPLHSKLVFLCCYANWVVTQREGEAKEATACRPCETSPTYTT